MSSNTLKDLCRKQLEVFPWIIWKEKSEIEGSQFDERISSRVQVEDLVELVDFGLEVRVDGDERK